MSAKFKIHSENSTIMHLAFRYDELKVYHRGGNDVMLFFTVLKPEYQKGYPEEVAYQTDVPTGFQVQALFHSMHVCKLMESLATNFIIREIQSLKTPLEKAKGTLRVRREEIFKTVREKYNVRAGITPRTIHGRTPDIQTKEALRCFQIWWWYQLSFGCTVASELVMPLAAELIINPGQGALRLNLGH
jgi:hypothetical protein